MASDATKSHIFQQLFSIKNTHKIIILGIYIIGTNSKILINAKKAVFAEVGASTHIKYAKKMKKFDRDHPKSRKSVFSARVWRHTHLHKKKT